MIITNVEQLRNVPVGEVATLVLQFMPVRTTLNCEDPCEGCILQHSGCIYCIAKERPDGAEVKFVKV